MGKTLVNINCDLGEGVPSEPELIPFIHSCSIACGGHYGDEDSILSTLKACKHNEVMVGAHPSYPDKINFGRKSMDLTKAEFQGSLREQLILYFSCLEKLQMKNHHIKAHGALYNDLAVQPDLCAWYLEVVTEFDFNMLYAPFNSALSKKANENEIKVLYEAFLDRNYLENGKLVPRSDPRALKSHPEEVWQQLKTFLENQGFWTLKGTWLDLPAETFCLHGDHPNALEFLKYIDLKLNQLR